MNDVTNTIRRSGWVTFVAIVAVIVGLYNALSGIAAIAESDTITGRAQEVLYGINIETWGWFWLIVGGVQLLTGILLFARTMMGAILALCIAMVSATFTVFVIFAFPLWGIAVLAMDIAVIWIILAHIDDFEES